MNDKLIKKANNCYQVAEKKAGHYFNELYRQVAEKTYISSLTKDIQSWKIKHIQPPSFFSFFSRRKKTPEASGYFPYIQWLNYTGKLDDYLDRSISYIYMRDLGRALDSSNTQSKIRSVAEQLKENLLSDSGKKKEAFSMAGLYKMAKKNGVESTLIWAMDKLKIVSANIPNGLDVVHAQRKILKVMTGVVMNEMEEMDSGTAPEVRAKRLEKAMKLGFYYGLTYPFIDDLFDAKILSDEEEKQYAEMIRTTLLTGNVPEWGKWRGGNAAFIHYVHSELREAFLYITAHQHPASLQNFLDQSYVFFHAQEVDRLKNLSVDHYTNEELYIPVILKSAASRLIVRSLISAKEDKHFNNQTFYYGIYNQLADDFADMFDDEKEGAVTPYTYYLKYHQKRKDLINPFALYWTVIAHLIHRIYNGDEKTCEVILDRAVNGLKRFKEKMGDQKYKEVMTIFATENDSFNRLVQQLVQKADNIDFFDKLLRDQMIAALKKERQEQEDFADTIQTVRIKVNAMLPLLEEHKKDPIIDAANYSLGGDGKRLRPIIAWFMAVKEYELHETAVAPLLKSLEYMHTASLIFDDLPSQDNAAIRRGRPTLHEAYNTATAELTGLFLTQKAIWEQTMFASFDAKIMLSLIQYTAKMTGDMCKGQAMDLDSRGRQLTLEQLKTISYYKTGIAFEAALIMPAILAQANNQEIKALKKYAYHAGIAFQMKDDLLDVEGDAELTGKQIGKDYENNHSTFVSILGVKETKIEMWDHYCLALEALEEVPQKTNFLKHLADYIMHRKR